MKNKTVDFAKLKKRDLYNLALKLKIKGRGLMSKPQLLNALKKHYPVPSAAAPVSSPRASASSASSRPAGTPKKPAPTPASAYVDRGPALPEKYLEDRIQLLPKDPCSLYCYWELSSGRYEAAVEKQPPQERGNLSLILKLKELDSNSIRIIRIGQPAGNWYFSANPGSRYLVEIGLLLPDGTFLLLATSNEISTPRAGLSPEGDEQWMTVKEELYQQFDHKIKDSLSSLELVKRDFLGRLQHSLGAPGVSSHTLSRRELAKDKKKKKA